MLVIRSPGSKYPVSWESTTSRCGAGSYATVPSTLRPVCASTSWKDASPMSSRTGSASILGSRSCAGAYGEAVRSALTDAVQVSDRWHLWHGLAQAAWKEVAAPVRLLGGSRRSPAAGGQARRLRASAGSRSVTCQSGRRPRRLLAATGPGHEHGQAPRPCLGTRVAAPRLSTGPLSSPSTVTTCANAAPNDRGTGSAAAVRDPRGRLPGQFQPAGPQPPPRPADAARSHRKAVQLMLSRPENLTGAARSRPPW